MTTEPTVKQLILNMCNYGCRFHPPRDPFGRFKQRSCPARMLAFRIKAAGYNASLRRGRVTTDCPREVLQPLYDKVLRLTDGNTTWR